MNLKVSDAKREDGFTLIELLVVVIIIGILAAIAIPVFLNQRTQARESAVESTLRSAATYMEIGYTNNTAYPASEGTPADDPITGNTLASHGFRSGDRVTINSVTVLAGDESYEIEAQHADDADVIFCFESVSGVPDAGAC